MVIFNSYVKFLEGTRWCPPSCKFVTVYISPWKLVRDITNKNHSEIGVICSNLAIERAPPYEGFLASFIHWVHRGRDSNRVHLTTSDISWMDVQFDDLSRATTRRPVSLCTNGIYLRKYGNARDFKVSHFQSHILLRLLLAGPMIWLNLCLWRSRTNDSLNILSGNLREKHGKASLFTK
jgi:hypothetical protein